MTPQHQFYQASDLIPLAALGCPEDSLPQVLDPFLNELPVYVIPIES